MGKLLKGFIVKQAQRGFGLDRAGVINFLTGFLHHDYKLEKQLKYPYNENCDNSTNQRFSRHGIEPEDHKKWYTLFMARHNDLKKRVPEQISSARSAVTQTSIYQWFSDISSVFNDKEDPQLAAALEDPHRIFNMDETSVQLCSIPNYVITSPVLLTGQEGKDMCNRMKHIYYKNPSQEKACLTVLTTVQASGQVLPPLVIYPRIRLTNIEAKITDPDTGEEMHYVLGKSPNSGWITSAVLYEYLVNDFNNWLTKNNIQRPVILFSDFHDTRNNYHLAKRLTELGIVLICLYPNSTHLLQPLDVSCFKPLKTAWKREMTKLNNRNNTIEKEKDKEKITIHNFAKYFVPILNTAITPETIKNGFKKTGLYPWNREAVDYSKCTNENVQAVNVAPLQGISVDGRREFAVQTDNINSIALNK